MNVLDKIKELGLSQFPGNDAMADEFVKGFTKQAFGGPETFGESFSKGVGGGLGKGVGGMAVGLGLHGVSAMLNSVRSDRLHTEFLAALQRAIASNPVLKGANKEKVKNYAETVFRFAPNVATDSNLLSSVLANAIHGEGIDPMTVRSLTDLESRYSESLAAPIFSPKSYV